MQRLAVPGQFTPECSLPPVSSLFAVCDAKGILANLTARVGPVFVPSSLPRGRQRRSWGPACGCGARARACRRRRRGPGFAGGRSCISSAVHRSVLLALSPSDPSRSSAGRPTGSERSPAGTPLPHILLLGPATSPAKPGFIMCLCSAAPAAGSRRRASDHKEDRSAREAGGRAGAGWSAEEPGAAAAPPLPGRTGARPPPARSPPPPPRPPPPASPSPWSMEAASGAGELAPAWGSAARLALSTAARGQAAAARRTG